MLSVKQGGIKYYFWVFSMTPPETEPRLPGPFANTLPTNQIKTLDSELQDANLRRIVAAGLMQDRPTEDRPREAHSRELLPLFSFIVDISLRFVHKVLILTDL